MSDVDLVFVFIFFLGRLSFNITVKLSIQHATFKIESAYEPFKSYFIYLFIYFSALFSEQIPTTLYLQSFSQPSINDII